MSIKIKPFQKRNKFIRVKKEKRSKRIKCSNEIVDFTVLNQNKKTFQKHFNAYMRLMAVTAIDICYLVSKLKSNTETHIIKKDDNHDDKVNVLVATSCCCTLFFLFFCKFCLIFTKLNDA